MAIAMPVDGLWRPMHCSTSTHPQLCRARWASRPAVSQRRRSLRAGRPVIRACAASSDPALIKPSSAQNRSLSDIVWPSAGSFVAMAAMSAIHRRLSEQLGLVFLVAPFGAVCCVLFVTPDAPAAQAYNVLLAHTGCALIGVASLALLGPGWASRGIALAACIAFMQCCQCLHPPAAGLPLLFIDAPKFHSLRWWYILFPSAMGCLLLIPLQRAVKFLKENVKF